MEDVPFVRSEKSNLESIPFHSIRLDPVPQGIFWSAARAQGAKRLGKGLIGSGMPGKGIRLRERLGTLEKEMSRSRITAFGRWLSPWRRD